MHLGGFIHPFDARELHTHGELSRSKMWTGTGTSTHNEKTNTWTMRATSHGPFGRTVMKGCMKVIDDDTMEWCWSEYALGGLMKTMEMCGTSKRK